MGDIQRSTEGSRRNSREGAWESKISKLVLAGGCSRHNCCGTARASFMLLQDPQPTDRSLKVAQRECERAAEFPAARMKESKTGSLAAKLKRDCCRLDVLHNSGLFGIPWVRVELRNRESKNNTNNQVRLRVWHKGLASLSVRCRGLLVAFS